MHNLTTLPHHTAQTIDGGRYHTESQEHQQVDIGKLIDELTDGIIWRYLFQQFILMNPAEGKLVACHLHPYRVDGICRQRLDVRHNDTLMLTDGDGVLL